MRRRMIASTPRCSQARGARSAPCAPRHDMDRQAPPPFRDRVRWGNVGRAGGLLALVVLVLAWPHLRAPEPALPPAAPVPVAPTTGQAAHVPPPAPPRPRPAVPRPAIAPSLPPAPARAASSAPSTQTRLARPAPASTPRPHPRSRRPASRRPAAARPTAPRHPPPRRQLPAPALPAPAHAPCPRADARASPPGHRRRRVPTRAPEFDFTLG